MDAVRYYLALVTLMMAPGALLYWFSVHPCIRFWRRVGARRTLAIHLTGIAVVAAAMFAVRQPLLAAEFGTSYLLIGVAAPLVVFSGWLRKKLSKQLKARILMGVPELEPEKSQSGLLTEGVYARIRHPRYVQLLVTLLAYALFTNYLAVYVIFLVSIPIVGLIIRIEEKELRDRFGQEFEQYRARVPALIPRRG